MYMQIRLPLACLLIMMYCSWYYIRKKHLATKASRAFNAMIVVTIVNLVFTTITEYTVNNRDIVPDWANYALHVPFIMSLTAWCGLILLYLLLLVERDGGGSHRWGKSIICALCGVIMLAQIFLPIEYLDLPGGSTSYGPKAFSVYIVVVYVLTMLLYLSVRYRTILGRDNSDVLIASTLIFVTGSIIQILFPHVLLTSPAITLIMLGLMVNMEDAHQYINPRTGLYNELACRKIVQERLAGENRVEMGFYKFFGDEEHVCEAMRSIDTQIAHSNKYLMCGMIASDVLVVLPLFKFGDTPRLPQPLPAPVLPDDLPEDLVRIETQVLSFDDTHDYDYIENVLLDLRARLDAEDQQRDELTQLLRRNAFMTQVNGMIERGEEFAFVILDLDNMKTINDTLGHSVGDEALRTVAEIFRSSIRSNDVACRLGGDEFAIMVAGKPGAEYARAVVKRIQSRICDPEYVPDHLMPLLGLSVGVRIYRPSDGRSSFQELYEHADAALYEVKRNCKGEMACYLPATGGESCRIIRTNFSDDS